MSSANLPKGGHQSCALGDDSWTLLTVRYVCLSLSLVDDLQDVLTHHAVQGGEASVHGYPAPARSGLPAKTWPQEEDLRQVQEEDRLPQLQCLQWYA